MNIKIRKAVLPVAGLGTRLYPITKSQPKEMLPVYNKPAIQYVVEEAMRIDIDNFLFITANNKISIENYFDFPLNSGKHKKEQDIFEKTSFIYARQRNPLGLGDAIRYAKYFVNNDPFMVILADDLIEENSDFILKFKNCFQKIQSPIIAVKRVSPEEISKYGIIEGEEIEDGLFEISNMYEKPIKGETTSNLAIIGRYILTPDIFDYLDNEQPGVNGEIQLTGSLQNMKQNRKIYAMLLKDRRFDIGTLDGLLEANIYFGINKSKEKENLIKKIKKMIGEKND